MKNLIRNSGLVIIFLCLGAVGLGQWKKQIFLSDCKSMRAEENNALALTILDNISLTIQDGLTGRIVNKSDSWIYEPWIDITIEDCYEKNCLTVAEKGYRLHDLVVPAHQARDFSELSIKYLLKSFKIQGIVRFNAQLGSVDITKEARLIFNCPA